MTIGICRYCRKQKELDIDELNKGLEDKYNNRIKLYFDTSDLLK